MRNISSPTAPAPDTNPNKTALSTLPYLLFVGAVLATGIGLCRSIDRRRPTGLSSAIFDEERNNNFPEGTD